MCGSSRVRAGRFAWGAGRHRSADTSVRGLHRWNPGVLSLYVQINWEQTDSYTGAAADRRLPGENVETLVATGEHTHVAVCHDVRPQADTRRRTTGEQVDRELTRDRGAATA